MANKLSTKGTSPKQDEKRKTKISQVDVPAYKLEEALRIPTAIVDNYAGAPTSPLNVATAISMQPTSGKFRMLCGTSIAYGLTEGGYNASAISVTPLARRILKPVEEGDDLAARREALLKPRVIGSFLRKYNGSPIPKDNIAQNVLSDMGVPNDKTADVLAMILESAHNLGLIAEIKGKRYVNLESTTLGGSGTIGEQEGGSAEGELEKPEVKVLSEELAQKEKRGGGEKISRRVFISHGKNKKIVEQLKDILRFGKFEPVVSVEREATSIPVPDKVFEDMRSCGAAVIHVMSEGELMDAQGNAYTKINENVLIEIGAAIALYRKNFLLLVEKDLKLPSNLQGLYRCDYEGESLDYTATMKLLKTFNQFEES